MTRLERIIYNTMVFRFLAGRSKKIILPGFNGVPLYDVINFFVRQVKKTSITERAAAIAYNFIMAIPPICLFLFTLIPHLPFVKKKALETQVNNLIIDIIPAKEHNKNLISFVNGFLDHPRIGLLSFGFILLLFFGSNGMMGIMRSFNKNYIGSEKRTGLKKRWIAIRLTLLIMSLLLACILLLVMQGFILKWMGITNVRVKNILGIARWVLIVFLIFYSIAFIYKYAPDINKKWRLFSPGSTLATSLSILCTVGFSLFVNNFGKYDAFYGSIGTVIVVMSLIFINSLILLIGYELNVSIHSLQSSAKERKQEARNQKPEVRSQK
ncbi:MAG TPA: YihY/virulence factor BrkB family protein [Chitinophagaceae bacterium]|jgi:membrane protein|nr:YihY/virulence factor BrkB family protein [Chitinophagaceae bacterium]